MASENLIAGIAGLIAGEGIADALVDDDNILGHVAVGLTGAAVVGGITKVVVKETGISDVLDDIFGF
jgi:hypothetical protein